MIFVTDDMLKQLCIICKKVDTYYMLEHEVVVRDMANWRDTPQGIVVYRASRGCVHRRCSYFAIFLW